jgi:hypothetical protein
MDTPTAAKPSHYNGTESAQQDTVLKKRLGAGSDDLGAGIIRMK